MMMVIIALQYAARLYTSEENESDWPLWSGWDVQFLGRDTECLDWNLIGCCPARWLGVRVCLADVYYATTVDV